MTASAAILSWSVWLAMIVLAVAFLATVWRVVRGPTLPDRVVALDMLVGIVIGFIALIAIRTGFTLYVDIAIALGLVGFLATVAFARFIMPRMQVPEAEGAAGEAPDIAAPAQPAAKPAKKAAKAPAKTTGAKPASTKSKAAKPADAAPKKQSTAGAPKKKPAAETSRGKKSR
ncbi:multicomponent Na+:H+ antiporter subunit F [Neorhizobium alkalisoli]|uniref:Multicomponent Na+:H+ antiporter subunit F n=1 Tax=Neorhizobium alkalisoli TaxID=528178 RepID=A0A561QWI6_9HYPH|nr:cation:proton antiporter [Neorhizobium alkalisoli]TWF54730.1 multicomponent Na+:H+ antiporter subunit F [Neorhizobium alkalisoli]